MDTRLTLKLMFSSDSADRRILHSLVNTPADFFELIWIANLAIAITKEWVDLELAYFNEILTDDLLSQYSEEIEKILRFDKEMEDIVDQITVDRTHAKRFALRDILDEVGK